MDLNKHTTYAIEEAKLKFYIDYLGIEKVRHLADIAFYEIETSTGSHFLDLLDLCEVEFNEEEIKRFESKKGDVEV